MSRPQPPPPGGGILPCIDEAARRNYNVEASAVRVRGKSHGRRMLCRKELYMSVYSSIEQLIGHTPLIELTRLEAQYGLQARLLAKAEYFNPAGSVKDRTALYLLNDAERRGLLTPQSVIIEPTSGNTGVALAALAAVRGYRIIIVMPENKSIERRRLMQGYGAELVLTPASEDMPGAIARAEELAKQIPGSVLTGQFVNPANAQAHYETTGPEIWADTEGRTDIFVAGIGTGGTITGVGRYLREQNPAVRIVGVEPAGSAVLSGGEPGPHKLQGLGAGFVPQVLDTSVYHEIIAVSDDAAIDTARELARKEGLQTGISSGAALWAALQVASRPESARKNVVVLLPDTAERYFSTALFAQ